MHRLFPFDYTFIIASRHSSLLVHNHPTSLGKRERQGGPFTLSPRQRSPCTPAGAIPCTPFSSHLRWFCISGEFGWKGKYIVVPSSEKVRKEP